MPSMVDTNFETLLKDDSARLKVQSVRNSSQIKATSQKLMPLMIHARPESAVKSPFTALETIPDRVEPEAKTMRSA